MLKNDLIDKLKELGFSKYDWNFCLDSGFGVQDKFLNIELYLTDILGNETESEDSVEIPSNLYGPEDSDWDVRSLTSVRKMFLATQDEYSPSLDVCLTNLNKKIFKKLVDLTTLLNNPDIAEFSPLIDDVTDEPTTSEYKGVVIMRDPSNDFNVVVSLEKEEAPTLKKTLELLDTYETIFNHVPKKVLNKL